MDTKWDDDGVCKQYACCLKSSKSCICVQNHKSVRRSAWQLCVLLLLYLLKVDTRLLERGWVTPSNSQEMVAAKPPTPPITNKKPWDETAHLPACQPKGRLVMKQSKQPLNFIHKTLVCSGWAIFQKCLPYENLNAPWRKQNVVKWQRAHLLYFHATQCRGRPGLVGFTANGFLPPCPSLLTLGAAVPTHPLFKSSFTKSRSVSHSKQPHLKSVPEQHEVKWFQSADYNRSENSASRQDAVIIHLWTGAFYWLVE